jgi:basic amino acid/polyamine antiporter, APA family
MTRKLGFFEVFSITSGAMISSGLFILPGIAHAQAGPAVVISYFLAGLLAIAGMLSMVEIVTAMPMAGGNYFFITRTMGPAVGSVAGLLSWFALTLKSSFALVGISAFLVIIVDWDYHLVALTACLAFVAINVIGSRESGRVQVVLIAALLLLMLLYAAVGFSHVEGRNILPFAPQGWNPVLSTAGLIFVSYGGLLQVGSIAEEVRNPGRVIPRAMIASFVVILILYVTMLFVTTGVLGGEAVNDSLTPITDGAGAFMGRTGAVVMSVAAILAFVSTANSGILTASRYLLGLSRDNLIPAHFGRVNQRFQTPHTAVVVTGIVVMITLFLRVELLAEAASSVLILTYALSCVSLIILRESRLFNYRPQFRSPWYPILPAAGIVGYAIMLFTMGPRALLISAALVAGGLLFYLLYGKARAKREFALLHVIERASDRALTNGMLESELKEIVLNRDLIDLDRFDKMVERAPVIDCPPSDPEELFQSIAGTLEKNFGLDATFIEGALKERKRHHSAILQPGVAVSDIVVDGESIFEMVLVRCRRGMYLEEGRDKVRLMFFLVTTTDERDFYLQAVASVAQIIQDPNFENLWLQARDKQQLRDLVVLGTRRRVALL